MNRFDVLYQMRKYMNDQHIVNELVDALSNDEAKENFEYIIRMWDLPIEIEN